MTFINKNNKDKLYNLITYISIFLLLLLLNYFTIWAADDFAFYNKAWLGQNNFSLSRVFSTANNFYLTWTGRYISSFINYIFLYFDKWIFNIFNSLVFTSMIILINKIIELITNKKNNFLNIILTFCLIWIFMPAFGQVVLWQIGSVIYLWTFTSLLLILYLFIKSYKNESKPGLILSFLFFLFSIISGNGFETNSLMLLIFMTLLLLYAFIKNKKKISLFMLSGYFGSIIGFATNFFSPGNSVRMQNMTASSDSLFYKLFSGIGLVTYRGIGEAKLWILLIILSIIFLIYYLNINKKNFKRNELFVLLFSLSFIIFIPAIIYILQKNINDCLFLFNSNVKFVVIICSILFINFVGILIKIFIDRKEIFLKKDLNINIYTILFFISAILGVCEYIITPYAWARSYMGMSIFLVIVILIIINNKSSLKFLKCVTIALFLGVLIHYSFTFKDIYNSKSWENETREVISSKIKEGETYIEVDTLKATNSYDAASIEKWVIPSLLNDCENITENNIHIYYEWINIAITNYYYHDAGAWKNGNRIVGKVENYCE